MTIFRFRSWIPTVGGRLSFSICGESDHPYPVVSANVSDGTTRFFVAYQKRITGDSTFPLLPDFFLRFVKGWTSDYRFLCIAQAEDIPSEDESAFRGKLLFFDRKGERSSWRSVEQKVRSVIHELRLTQDKAFYQRIYARLLREDWDELSFQSHYFADFTLLRNGIVTLEVDSKALDRSLAQPYFTINDESEHHKYCEQLFYFLKDICHVHQHHHPTSDTLVDLYRLDHSQSWIPSVIRTLYRKVLSYKRHKGLSAYYGSKGVLHYLSAFIQIQEKWLHTNSNHHLIMNNTLIENSIDVSIAKENDNLSRRVSTAELIRTAFLTMFAILVSILGLSSLIPDNKLPSPPQYFVEFVSSLITNPHEVLLWAVVLSVMVILVSHIQALPSLGFVRRSIKTLISFRRPVAILILSLLGFGSMEVALQFRLGTSLLAVFGWVG